MVRNCSAKYYGRLKENGRTVVGFLTVGVGSDSKDICSIHEGRLSVYCMAGIDEGHVKNTQAVSLRVSSRQNKMSLLLNIMLKILIPMADVWSSSLS